MKTFKQLREDIDMTDVMAKPSKKKRPYIGMHEDDWRAHAATQNRKIEPIGKIGKHYTAYSSINRYGDNDDQDGADSSNPQRRVAHYTHHFITVHNKTKKVVASAVGMGERGSWRSAATFVHPEHKSTKVGFSIPAEMYKHISKTHEVWADREQTPGAAKMWKGLINDPKIKGKNKVKHIPEYGKWGKPQDAQGMPDDQIWATHKQDKGTNATAKKLGITPHQGDWSSGIVGPWGRSDSEKTAKTSGSRLMLPRRKK